MTTPVTFDEYRLDATKRFAHTLIVVDDEASNRSEASELASNVLPARKPTRAEARKSSVVVSTAPTGPVNHPLNADILTETSMGLGLICSILKPKKSDKPATKVAIAAQKADILCIDWEMHNDSGKTAINIIKAVLERDEGTGGRFRLIAIYTGVSDKDNILKKVFASIAKKVRDRRSIVIKENYLASHDGLRIVWLMKKGGVKNRATEQYTVSENELPERLQREFSYLSEGILTNVAIATIASIRDATHHVIARFSKKMDGPYFHHRSTILSPEDAQDYATQVIVSELKNSIDGNLISSVFAGKNAIEKAIDRSLLSKDQIITVNDKKVSVPYGTYKDFILDGIAPTLTKLKATPNPLKASAETVSEQLIGPFNTDSDTSMQTMLEFAALTCLAAESGSRYSHHRPALSLGSIIRDADKTFLLCLQASCDSVRLQKPQPFLFAQLEIVPSDQIWKLKNKIEFVVPMGVGKKKELVCLKLSDKAPYAALRSIIFSATHDEQVIATKSIKTGQLRFTALNAPPGKRAAKHKSYEWIADVKKRRALRTVQYIGQQMGRIGFDEFEAFRRKYSS